MPATAGFTDCEPDIPRPGATSPQQLRKVVDGFDEGTAIAGNHGLTAKAASNGTLFLEEPSSIDDGWYDDFTLEDKIGKDLRFEQDEDDYQATHEFHEFRGMPKAADFPRELRQLWKAEMGMKPEKFFKELFDTPNVDLGSGDIVVSREAGAGGEANGMEINVDLASPGTRRTIGRMSRSFTFSEDEPPEVYHSLLDLDPEAQGKGIAKDLLANSIDIYDRAGISKVGVFASLDVGGYAWAKFGFKPKNRLETRLLFGTLRDRLENLDAPESTKAVVRNLLSSNDPEAVWAISDMTGIKVTHEGQRVPLGKALLLETSWHGTLDLDDASSRARFDQYVHKA